MRRGARSPFESPVRALFARVGLRLLVWLLRCYPFVRRNFVGGNAFLSVGISLFSPFSLNGESEIFSLLRPRADSDREIALAREMGGVLRGGVPKSVSWFVLCRGKE